MSARTKAAKEAAQKVSKQAEQRQVQREFTEATYTGEHYNPVKARLGEVRKALLPKWFATQKPLERDYLQALSEVKTLDELRETEEVWKALIAENDKKFNDTGVFWNKPMASEIDLTNEISVLEKILDAERLLSELAAPAPSGVPVESASEQIAEPVAS